MSQSDYTMDDFRAEMHRRKYGEQLGPKRPPLPKAPKPKPEPAAPKRPRVRWNGRESWANARRDLLESVKHRLADLAKLPPDQVMPCPWGAVFGGECLEPCRCAGKRTVTVGFMRSHYQQVLTMYAEES